MVTQLSAVPNPAVIKFEWPSGQKEEGFPLEPFEDIVYIEQITEERTRGGLYIPLDSDHSKMPMGRVVAVGPGKFYHAPFNVAETYAAVVFIPSKLRVGDIVVWGRWTSGGEPKIINGKTIIGAREGDLGGRVLPNPDGTLPVIRLKPQE